MLKLFDCEVDLVIAESKEEALLIVANMHGEAKNTEEALQVIENEYGCDPSDYSLDNWNEWDPTALLKMNYPDEGKTEEKPVTEWIKLSGKGYFASTEY